MEVQSIDSLIEKVQNGSSLSSDDMKDLSISLKSYSDSLHYGELVHELSQIGFQDMKGDSWRTALITCFEKMGKSINADRIRYYDFTVQSGSGEPGLKPEVVWRSEHIKEKFEPYNLSGFLPRRKYTQFFKKLESHTSFQARITEENIGPMKVLMQADNCQAILVLPIKNKSTLYGIIRIDKCDSEFKWSQSQLTLLHPLVFQFRNLFERRDLEKQLQNTYRQARIGTWEMDIESGGFSWSAVTKEIFEIDEGRVPDADLAADIIYDDDTKDLLMKAVERTQITGEPYDLEVKIKTAKGNVKWVRDTGRAEFKNGKCVRLYGIVQDIHQRKTAERESEKNKRLLEAITQQTEVAVWVRDDAGNILFVNKQWKSIFGLGSVNVIGKSLHDFFNESEANEMISSDRSVISRNKQVIFEEFIDTAIGPRHYMVNKFPFQGISGLENAVGGIGTDITEIKQTEERLQQTKQKLREIIEHSTNLFYTHDVNHTLTYLSPQSNDFLGYAPEEAKRRWTEFVTDHPDNQKGFEATQRAINTGKAQGPFELQLKRGDSEFIWVEVNEAPVVKDGKTVSVAGSLTDITKRKKAQNKIRESLREKETLLAEIHHRVKNNLAVVASLMQLQAMESESSDVQGELLESVLRIKSMAGIHEHLYKTEDFSNLDFAHNLKVLVKDIIDTMQFSAQISIEFECSDVSLSVNQAIPCSLIINEVVTNIIKHGFRDKQKGTVQVRLHQENDKIEITITDNGDGFPENFDPESTNTLGMQLIKTLSSQLFGTYNFQSRDVGAVFTLLFEKDADQSVPNL